MHADVLLLILQTVKNIDDADLLQSDRDSLSKCMVCWMESATKKLANVNQWASLSAACSNKICKNAYIHVDKKSIANTCVFWTKDESVSVNG